MHCSANSMATPVRMTIFYIYKNTLQYFYSTIFTSIVNNSQSTVKTKYDNNKTTFNFNTMWEMEESLLQKVFFVLIFLLLIFWQCCPSFQYTDDDWYASLSSVSQNSMSLIPVQRQRITLQTQNKIKKKHIRWHHEIHHEFCDTKQDNAQTVYKDAQIEKKGLILEQVVWSQRECARKQESVRYKNIVTEKLLTSVANR